MDAEHECSVVTKTITTTTDNVVCCDSDTATAVAARSISSLDPGDMMLKSENQCMMIMNEDKINVIGTISQQHLQHLQVQVQEEVDEQEEGETAVTGIEHIDVVIEEVEFMSDDIIHQQEDIVTMTPQNHIISSGNGEEEGTTTISLAFTGAEEISKYNWHVENTDDIVVIQTEDSVMDVVETGEACSSSDPIKVINYEHVTCHMDLEGEIMTTTSEDIRTDTFPAQMEPCPVTGCQWFLFSGSALKKHVSSHHETLAETDTVYKCALCDVFIDSVNNLQRHNQEMHSGGPMDPVLESVQLIKNTGENDINPPADKFTIGKMQIVDFYFILRRSICKTKKTKRASRFYRCIFCSFGTARKPAMVRHMTNPSTHDPNEETQGVELNLSEDEKLMTFSELSKFSPPTTLSDGKGLVCQECGKTFQKRYLFLRHMEVHSNIRLLCDICGKEFRRKRQLWKHQQVHTKPSNVDPDTKVWKCSECSFESKVNVEIHAHRQLHPTDKSVKCDVCDASFGDRPSMNKHRRRMHAADRPFPCPCTECHYRFAKLAALKSHMSQAHNFNGRYKCVICGYLFRWKAHVKRHLAKVHDKQSFDTFIVAVKNCPQVELKSHENSSMITVMIDPRQ